MNLKTLTQAISVVALLLISSLNAQTTQSNAPKLVVGIVVDQMRYDYITRFWDDYSKDGFKR